MATKLTKKTNIVGISSIVYMRAMPINFIIKNAKPLTRLYAFFDGISVDQYITPTTLTTDVNGSASGVFNVPSATFTTGTKTLRFQDNVTFSGDVAGSLVSSAEAEFTATGIKRTIQSVKTEIHHHPKPRPPGDPLAQTFFTYGITGGCFVPKIDIYFQTKDANIPVTLEIRNVDNGYPSNTLVSVFATKSLLPSEVTISNDASIPTSFVFDSPVYLEEDKDYCFVLTSNCNSYHVWTSKLGETSIETKKTVFEQPFIGTLFKSENNITWTAEQTEDIKFTIYKAKFNTAVSSSLLFNSKSEPILVNGSDFNVTSGSATVTATFKNKHSLQTSSWIKLYSLTGANYRGIPAANLNGEFQVTRINDYTIQFTTLSSVAATSTGTLASIGFVKKIIIDAGGTGYTTGTALTLSGNATATIASVSDTGAITGVTITSGGSGYLAPPTVTASGGTGASLVAITEALFGIETNQLIHTYIPVITNQTVTDTEIVSNLKPILSGYDTTAQTYPVVLNDETTIPKNGWLVSGTNDVKLAGGINNYLTKINNVLYSSNENTSPFIYLNDSNRLVGRNYIINSSTEIGTTENSATGGLALSKYITKPITLAATSVGVRVFVSAFSLQSSGFDVYIRTSLSGKGITHKTLNWTKLNCDVSRNKSTKENEFLDYTFYYDGLPPFDVYDLKIVMYSDDSSIVPIIENYRVIILAS